MKIPLIFDIDKFADMLNGIIGNLITAIIIFCFVYAYRNRPKLIITAKASLKSAIMNPGMDDEHVRIFGDVKINFTNHSVYDAYLFNISRIVSKFEKNAVLQEYEPKILANSTLTVILKLEFIHPLQVSHYEKDQTLAVHELQFNHYSLFIHPLKIYYSYFKPDNRKISSKKTIYLQGFDFRTRLAERFPLFKLFNN